MAGLICILDGSKDGFDRKKRFFATRGSGSPIQFSMVWPWLTHLWSFFFSSKNLQNNLVFVGFFSSKKTIFHHISMGWPWFHQQKHPKNPWFLQLEVGGPRSCQVHVDGLGIKPEKRWGYPRYLRCWILFNQHLLKQLAHIYRWYIGKYGIHGTVLYSVSSVSWKLQLF